MTGTLSELQLRKIKVFIFDLSLKLSRWHNSQGLKEKTVVEDFGGFSDYKQKSMTHSVHLILLNWKERVVSLCHFCHWKIFWNFYKGKIYTINKTKNLKYCMNEEHMNYPWLTNVELNWAQWFNDSYWKLVDLRSSCGFTGLVSLKAHTHRTRFGNAMRFLDFYRQVSLIPAKVFQIFESAITSLVNWCDYILKLYYMDVVINFDIMKNRVALPNRVRYK